MAPSRNSRRGNKETAPPTASDEDNGLTKVVNVEKWRKMNKKCNLLEKVQRKLEKETKEKENIAAAFESVTELKNKLQEEVDFKKQQIIELMTTIDIMTQSLRKGGKVAPCELNQQLKERVTAAAKEYLFRTVKFVEDDEDLKSLTKDIIQYLPNKEDDIKPNTVKKFQDLYYIAVNDGIKLARQYVCNEGKKRVQGKFRCQNTKCEIAKIHKFLIHYTMYVFKCRMVQQVCQNSNFGDNPGNIEARPS